MTTPILSAPVLFFPADLKTNPKLTTRIVELTNDAFARSKAPDPEKWSTTPRFVRLEQYHDMLVEKCVVAVIFDKSADLETSHTGRDVTQAYDEKHSAELSGKIVACSAAVPWTGGWAKEGAGTEDGWEIKAISVNGDAKYLRRGLAIQVMDALEKHLIENGRRQRRESQHGDTSDGGQASGDKKDTLSLWILAAECINGAYWRRRGYHEVRKTTEGNGTWGCKTSFDLVVFRKDVSY